jgi:hypothetical protein
MSKYTMMRRSKPARWLRSKHARTQRRKQGLRPRSKHAMTPRSKPVLRPRKKHARRLRGKQDLWLRLEGHQLGPLLVMQVQQFDPRYLC